MNEYLKPWTTGDTKTQEDVGYREGYQDGLRGGSRDNTDIDTPYNRGYCAGYTLGMLEREDGNSQGLASS